MKAIRVRQFGGPDVMTLAEIPDPVPQPQQVLVRVHAAGVNPVETYIRTGTYARKPALPYTPGSDAGGVIEAVGRGATRLRVGQRVFVASSLDDTATGTYAEKVACHERFAHPLAERASFAQGAAIGVPCGTAYRALFQKARIQAGETVFVHGASGGVGLAAVQLAHAFGCRVLATAGSARGRTLVEEHGADQVFDHTRTGYLDEVMRATEGRGADVILEMLANVNLGHDLGVIALRGRLVIIGNRGEVQINPRGFMGRDVVLYGMTMFNTSPDDLQCIYAGLRASLESGVLRPVIGRELPLADAAKAHEAVMQPGAYGKIVLLT